MENVFLINTQVKREEANVNQNVLSIMNINDFLHNQKMKNNVAIVVTDLYLEQYDHVIIVENPTFKSKKSCPDGIIDYGDKIVVDGETLLIQENTTLWIGHNITSDMDKENTPDIAININVGGSVVIAARKTEVEDCIMKSNGKLDVHFQYPHATTFASQSPKYVLLSVIINMKDDPNDFHPKVNDSVLFDEHKSSIVQEGKHYRSTGKYYADGIHSSYEQYTDGSPKSVSRYATKDTPPHRRTLFDERINAVNHFVRSCNNAFKHASGFNIVEQSATNTTNNGKLGLLLNSLTNQYNAEKIDLSPIMVGNDSAIFPSVNTCVNAGTGTFHTENDQGYTLIATPYQDAVKRATFVLSISSHFKVGIRLDDGMANLFNARLLTHRQVIDTHRGGHDFWSIGCYGNRRLEQNTFTLLRRHYDLVLENLHDFI